MGKALQIRVSAVTWNEDLLEQLWPQLTELAFSVPIKHEKRGVLEMVRALDEGLTFMKWSKARQDALGPGIREAARLKQELEAAPCAALEQFQSKTALVSLPSYEAEHFDNNRAISL